ncbi:MAG: cadherin-like beta sandwich domain-containing protein, partial [Candidatus Aphodocola sp.]
TTTTTKAKSDNNYLSSISVNEEELSDFSKTTTKYYVEVDNDTKKISIDATAEDELASVDIDGPKSLSVGDNEYTISVTSESNTTKIYKVIVTRAEKEESSSTDVKNIKVKGYNLNFDKNSKTFYLSIDKEDTELDITVTLKDKNADYEIEGNEDLKDGSEIKIKVTAEDGTTDTYRIIIEKKETNMMPVIIGIIILLIIIIIVIVMVVINKKKKKNSSSKSTKNEVKDKDDNEKTKEMPTIDSEEEKSDDHDETYEQIPIDNDEEEKTRMLSFAEEERLEKTKVINSDLDNDIDEEFEKTMLFNTDDFDDE